MYYVVGVGDGIGKAVSSVKSQGSLENGGSMTRNRKCVGLRLLLFLPFPSFLLELFKAPVNQLLL